MKAKQIREVLPRHGFFSGRMIAHSKTGYGRRHPGNWVVFNANVFTRRRLILQLVDLDLTIDAEKLAAAAREVGENLFVLPEGFPGRFWEPGQSPIAHMLRDAIWWTRIRPEDADVFWPVVSTRRRPRRLPLVCAAGTGESEPAYGVGYWENEPFHSMSILGASAEMAGLPPREFQVKQDLMEVEISRPPSSTRGRSVRPVFYQQSGPLDHVWFSHGAAIPALLYDQVLRPLSGLNFTVHHDNKAIHVRAGGPVIGLIWPGWIGAPEVVASARRQLGLKDAKDTKFLRTQKVSQDPFRLQPEFPRTNCRWN